MRIILSNFLLILNFSSCMAQSNNFRLNLKIIQKERSRDSNSSIETFSIQGDILSYRLTYQGRRSSLPKKHKQVNLHISNIEKIRDLLEQRNLYQNIQAPKRNEFQTPYIATEVLLNVNKEEDSFQIQLYDLSSQISENNVFQNIQDLKQLLKSYVK